MANNSDFYNCTTIYMGKYVDSIGEGARYTDDVEIAKHFVEAFALWFDLELFDECSSTTTAISSLSMS